MITLLTAVAVACLAGGLILIAANRRATQKMRMRMRKIDRSDWYQAMLERIAPARSRYIEQLTVSSEGVRVRLLYPLGREYVYRMAENRLEPLTPERCEAVAALLQEAIPCLGNARKYRCRARFGRLANGTPTAAYVYVIQNAHKGAAQSDLACRPAVR